MMKSVACYVRVSTAEQAKEGYSIHEQRERLEKYCEALGWNSYKVYTDGGFSGGDTNRPALQEMIRDIKTGKIEKVLVYKLDRLSRSQKDTLELIEDIFLKNNCDFVSMTEVIDTSTPFGRAVIGILAAFAQLEKDLIKERMSIGRDARAKKGKYHGGNNDPIGYEYKNGELHIVDYEAMQIREIFKLALDGIAAPTILKMMREKYTTRNGIWHESTINKILHSKLYIGYIKYDGVWHKGIHESIIDEKTFDDAQLIMQNRAEKFTEHNRRSGKATTYFGGYLYCKHCGAKYSVCHASRKRKDGTYWKWRKYSCNSRVGRGHVLTKDPNCKNEHWEIDELTNQVFDEIKKLSLDPAYLASEIQTTEDNKKEIVQKEIDKKMAKISKLMDLYSDDNMPQEILQEKIRALNEDKIALEEQLIELEMSDAEMAEKEEIVDAIQNFEDVLENGNFAEIRALIAILIDRIEIDNNDLIIHWNFV